jgi:hypothetical protein
MNDTPSVDGKLLLADREGVQLTRYPNGSIHDEGSRACPGVLPAITVGRMAPPRQSRSATTV